MSDYSCSSRIVHIEIAILRALCSRTATESARRSALRDLAGYRWLEADHAVIYEAIVRAGVRGANWREDLPARTTRMGFPDLDWTIYLEPKRGNEQPLEKLVRKLKAAARS
ncbi:MAG TPA: hypothetical protein VEJ46_18825 [Candidatus Acidoferrum sp.]|nr:hypothetical protein [Candidatus Acidoferrum sp.]